MAKTTKHADREALPLPGMAQAIDDQRQAAAAKQGEALTDKFNRPPADVSAKAGDIERRAPLFKDTDASGQARLF